MTVRVESYPRIHMGLFDVAGTTKRAYGGLGFACGGPRTVLEVSQANESTLSAEHLSERDRTDLRRTIDQWVERTNGSNIEVTVHRTPPQHVGLGTKTAMILGILAGANECWECGYSQEKLQQLSDRGGVSGIGINAFFNGGFLVDAGRDASAVSSFAPSSFSTPDEIPPVVVRKEFPSEWEITLFLPDGNIYEGVRELNFFEQNTPIPEEEVLEAMAVAYHGIIPAVIREDLSTLSEALAHFHRTGFKKREVEGQTENVRSTLDTLQSLPNVAAGMSSMGPLLYTVHPKDAEPVVESDNGLEILGSHPGVNQSATIQQI